MVQLKTLVALGAIVGGLCWIAKYFAERADASDGLLGVLYWAGLVLMTVAFLGAGVNLVKIGNHWLELVVGLATPALVWSVEWAFKSGDADPYVVDGVFGALVIVWGAVLIARRAGRGPQEPSEKEGGGGSHGRPGHRRATT